MNSIYRLIKAYPNSPAIGTLVYGNPCSNNQFNKVFSSFYKFIPVFGDSYDRNNNTHKSETFSYKEITDYKEFWKKVDQIFRITEFVRPDNSKISRENPITMYFKFELKIQSIIKGVNGVTIKIGCNTSLGIVNRIEWLIGEGDFRITTDRTSFNINETLVSIYPSEPLYTSFDGVALNAGDRYYYINDDGKIGESMMTHMTAISTKDTPIFYSKGEVDAFIRKIESIPHMSINDIKAYFHTFSKVGNTYATVNLKEMRDFAIKKLMKNA